MTELKRGTFIRREFIAQNRILIRQERALERDLTTVARRVADDAVRRFTITQNADQARDIVVTAGPLLTEVLRHNYMATAMLFGERVLKRVGIEPAKSYYGADLPPSLLPVRGRDFVDMETKGGFEIFQLAVQAWVTTAALTRSVLVQSSMVGSLRGIIASVLQAGGSEVDMRNALRTRLTSLRPWQLARIARTEAHMASGVGADNAAQASSITMVKEWAAAEDSRTRLSHAVADGQLKRPEEPFEVGSDKLMFPGDPSGSAKEIINCRCVALYHPVVGGKVMRE